MFHNLKKEFALHLAQIISHQNLMTLVSDFIHSFNHLSIYFSVLSTQRPVVDITKQNPLVTSEIFQNLFTCFTGGRMRPLQPLLFNCELCISWHVLFSLEDLMPKL
jgi:hypothetical protein